MWFIEDEAHAELQDGQFESRQEAMGELRRRRIGVRHGAQPRPMHIVAHIRYALVERDGSEEMSREPALEIPAAGVLWHLAAPLEP